MGKLILSFIKSTGCVGIFLILAAMIATPKTVQAQTKKALQSKTVQHEIIVGTSGHFPPYSMLNEKGVPYGFAIEVLDAVAKKAGLSLRYKVITPPRDVIKALRNGFVDVIPSLGISDFRKKDFAFTAPVEAFRLSLFLRKGTTGVHKLSDLKGRKIGAVKPNVAHRRLSERKDLNLVTYKSVPAALFALLSAQIDAFAYSEPVAWKHAREAGIDEKLKVAAIPIAEIKRGIAVQKDNQALLQALNPAVLDFIASDAYRKIYVKWFGRENPYWTNTRVALWMGGVLVLVLVLMALWHYNSTVNLNRNLSKTIEERRLVEEKLRQAHDELEIKVQERTRELSESMKEAMVASRSKSELMANMSHELRTPLNAIIGFSSMMQSEMLGPLSEKYKEYAKDINGSGEHLLELISDILDVSAIEAGKLELQDEELDVNSLIEATLHMVLNRAEEGKVQLSSHIADGLPKLKADRRRLMQVFLNLLTNAIKFTLPQGKVMITASLDNSKAFIFEVADSGIGIHKDDITKAMSVFGQVDSGLDRRQEGTGLGLPLSKGLVEQHGGTFEITSELGVGTTITLRLPSERTLPI
ncbi:MAG: transporter substrate-binding domain-containing protein [Rhodospirillales bacterium]|nr:transporter substrate-binding domain-containing protein [Rhodospirillales bacterium]